MSEKEEYVSKKDTLETGCFAEIYSENTFMKVYQAFAIDKVKLSFSKKGQHGKGVDIYMDIDEFDYMCDLITDWKMHTCLKNSQKNSAGYYLPAHEYKTGQNGTKTFQLMRGSKQPIVLVGKDSVKNEQVFVPTTYKSLMTMAKWWKRISVFYYKNMGQVGFEAKKAFKAAPKTE